MNYKRIGAYRLFFTSNDLDEPPHIHVECDGQVAKFWLAAVRLAKSARLRAHELAKIERIIRDEHARIMDAWHDLLRRRN